MSDTSTVSTPSPSSRAEDETLLLQCPVCKSALSLMRQHLGVEGQCIHCQIPIIAVETAQGVEVIRRDGKDQIAAHNPPATVSQQIPHEPEVIDIHPKSIPAEATATKDLESQWGFPPRSSSTEKSAPESVTVPPPSSTWDFIAAFPTRDEDNLFSNRPPIPRPREKTDGAPLFSEETKHASLPPFHTKEETGGVLSAWGTRVPVGIHASISPFGTGSADGGGFGDDLFREGAEKEISESTLTEPATSGESPSRFVAACDLAFDRSPLDSDRSKSDSLLKKLPPPIPSTATVGTLESEQNPDMRSFLANKEGKSFWKKPIVRNLLRAVVGLVIVTSMVAAIFLFVPRETLISWKDKALIWLEPGAGQLEFVPESLRPKILDESDNHSGDEDKPEGIVAPSVISPKPTTTGNPVRIQ